MHLTSRLTRSLNQPASASAFLGAEHPLARVLDRLAVALRQCLVAAALLCVSVAVLVAGFPGALAYVLAAALVQAGLACRAALLVQLRRELLLDLIIEGRGNLPLAAVERRRRHLLDRRAQVRLAAGLESSIERTLNPQRGPAAAPAVLMNPTVVGPLADELRAIAKLLRATPESARGVALAERLLADGGSALYGNDPVALREELGRARYLLQSGSGVDR